MLDSERPALDAEPEVPSEVAAGSPTSGREPEPRPAASEDPRSGPDPDDRRRAGRLLGLAAAVVVTLGGALTVALTAAPAPAPSPPPAATAAATTTAAAPAAPGPPAPVAPAAVRATFVDVPALGVRGDLVDLDVDATGMLEAPASPDVPGWFTGGAAPGDDGPTVIAGHVDSRAGPGVFYRLKDLVPGDEVTVGRSDGRTARYRVTDVQTVAKNAFPTQQVYGPTAGPELRLITCGGEFDQSIGHYLRNVVVSGVLVEPV